MTLAAPATYLDPALARPCTVHARYPAQETDEHGNVQYVDDPYEATCFVQQMQRTEDPTGRSASQVYLLIFNALEVFGHMKPKYARKASEPECSLDSFAWIDVPSIGHLEVEGDPSFPVSLREPTVVHHVEVYASRATTQSATS